VAGRLGDKVAIVTGGGSSGDGWGNGKATAVTFARHGAKVVVSDINVAAAEETAEIIRREGGECLVTCVDVRDEISVQEMTENTISNYGRIDILHNNVGILAPGGPENVDIADWERVFAVNLRGALFTCRYALPHMKARGVGSIINVSSIAAIRHLGPNYISYPTSKAALCQFTRILAAQNGSHGIRCNAILPGFIQTPMVESQLIDALGGTQDRKAALDAYYEKRIRRIPLGRLGDAWDVANAALFLASEESRYVNGIELIVDGGVTLGID
jgi:NAD(P)-dependent dehydrogenase (short-subunit alcohol dehydrogenase family)